MKKVVFSLFLGVLLICLVSAQGQGMQTGNSQGDGQGTGDNQIIGGDKDEHGCLVAAGYSWNESEQKCVREWETSESRYQNEQQIQTRSRVQDGTHIGEGGQMFKIQSQTNNRIRLEVEGVGVNCGLNITQTQVQNKTKLETKLSNGRNAEIKVMPNTASERALERLRLKNCVEEEGCNIELKEVRQGEQAKLAYEINTQRQSKLFGLFRMRMQVQAHVDAENGEIIQTKKPWWAFLASEPEE